MVRQKKSSSKPATQPINTPIRRSKAEKPITEPKVLKPDLKATITQKKKVERSNKQATSTDSTPIATKWLFKSEPNVFSWQQLVDKGQDGEEWDGVRNYQARNNMRSMKLDQYGFFYHSNIGKEIVGIAKVCATAHHDSTANDDEKWDCVDIKAVVPLQTPVTLSQIKETESLQEMSLVTSSRLSVQPVTEDQWEIICKMGGVDTSAI